MFSWKKKGYVNKWRSNREAPPVVTTNIFKLLIYRMQTGLLKTSGGGAKINFSNHFSRKFGLNISGHEEISFIDIYLTTDVKLYIDPTLIELVEDHWSNEAERVINDFFTIVAD